MVVSNEWDAGLTYRKAIYTPLASTLPDAYVIDLSNCLNQPPNYLPCRRCAEVCEDNAISFEAPLQVNKEIQVARVDCNVKIASKSACQLAPFRHTRSRGSGSAGLRQGG